MIGLSIAELVRAVSRPLLCSAGMLLVMLGLRAWLPATLGDGVRLTTLIIAGILAYAWGTWLYNRDSAREILAVARAGRMI